MLRRIISLMTHGIALAIGFALGVYLLPILTAPPAPDAATLQQNAADALYTASFTRELAGSDFLHWGEGMVSVTPTMVVHEGALSPGPDYRLYLAPEFVEDEAGFNALKDRAVDVGAVKTFAGFALSLPDGVDVEGYTTVVIWCEAFGEFITAAKYR